MERREELLKIISLSGTENKVVLKNLVDDVIFMEKHLVELKLLPFLRIDEQNPQRQQATPAAKQYKELLQQYTNTLKLLIISTGDTGDLDTSPLRLWAKGRIEIR